MAFVIADRVRETSTSTGTGNFTLGGAVTGYQTFDAVLDSGDTTYYTIADQGGANWEVGIGTFTSPSTLARTTILSSSNGGSVVTFTTGTKDVFISLPASKTNTNDQPNVISVNSTSDALRITQTGTGNALVVEDSTNPDATPLVVDSVGKLVMGATALYPSPANIAATNKFQINGNALNDASMDLISWSTGTATGANLFFARSDSGTIGTHTVVGSNDGLGNIRFFGSDGTAFVEGAAIQAFVDGTPGTNDMPTSLRFSTTADGASSPTERMRIGSTGSIGIGTAGTEPFTIRSLRSFSGATSAYGISQGGEIQSAVTSNAYINHTAPTTQATAFTLSNVYHYLAASLSIGAGSAVTSQYGFSAGSGLTAATNNYGFHSNIASGTGRWNFYANGTAANFFAGQVQLGAGSAATPALSTTGDTNTGMFFPAADTIAFAEGGVESMRIDSSGNVGIGTSSPGVRLDVSGTDVIARAKASSGYASFLIDGATGSQSYLFFKINDVETARIYSDGGNLIAFSTGSSATERMRIDSSGYVGIGTSSPGARLNVVNSSGDDAVRITHTGTTGNSFVVEDAANPDASPFVIDSAGRVISGYTSVITGVGTTVPRVQQAGTSANDTFYMTSRWDNSANAGGFDFAKSRGGSVSTNGIVTSGDTLGQIRFVGDDGAAFIVAASISSAVDGTPGTNDMPGRLVFSTTADGASGATERMRIDSAGNVRIGTAALATTATNGFLYVPTCAGTPTGVPTAITGLAPIVINTTNNKLYFYSGGAWRDAGP